MNRYVITIRGLASGQTAVLEFLKYDTEVQAARFCRLKNLKEDRVGLIRYEYRRMSA